MYNYNIAQTGADLMDKLKEIFDKLADKLGLKPKQEPQLVPVPVRPKQNFPGRR